MEYSTKIYLHKRLDTSEVFYVGIGGGDRHSETGTGRRSDYWQRVVNKAGYEVVVIEDCLTWEQACEIEILLVAHYGRRDRGKGPLVNLTDGGDGVKGHKHSPEARAKMSAAQKGNTSGSGNKGKPREPLSPEHRAKISAANKGMLREPFSPEHCAKISAAGKGHKHSPETRAKMSAARKAYWAGKR